MPATHVAPDASVAGETDYPMTAPYLSPVRAICYATPDPMRIAMLGTRGVPAAYGGFETAIEEIGQRLVGAGPRDHRLRPVDR